MSFFPSLILFAVLALMGYQGVLYYRASGTVAQRLAAAWSGSLTIFVQVWGTILVILTNGLDMLAQITGDPQFTQFADAVKGVIPTQYHPLVPVAVLGAGIMARLRTLPKA